MNKLLATSLLALSAQFAYADAQDIFPLQNVAEGSILKIEKSITIPARSLQINVYNVGPLTVIEDGDELKRASIISGCGVVMKDESTKARSIPAGAELVIESITKTNNYDQYTIKFLDSSIDYFECQSGPGSSDNDDKRAATQKEIINDEFSVDEQPLTIGDFNNVMSGLFSLESAPAVIVGADDSDRSVEGDADSAAPVEATAATQE